MLFCESSGYFIDQTFHNTIGKRRVSSKETCQRPGHPADTLLFVLHSRTARMHSTAIADIQVIRTDARHALPAGTSPYAKVATEPYRAAFRRAHAEKLARQL